MSNDLRLNSLERFQKNSERLVLEEHGHCEVPAGCGGVVLRWFNPNSGVPVILHAGFADQMTIFVDELQAASGRVTVPHGEHVLAVHAVFGEASARYFWLAGLYDRPEDRYPDVKSLLESLAIVEHGLCFRYVPAGTFLMGANDGDEDERPVHPVRLPEYWVTEAPITWATYCDLLGWSPPPEGVPRKELPDRMMVFALHNENKIRLQYCETETKGARDWHAHRPDDQWSSGRTSQELFGEVPREHPNRPMQYDEKPMVCVSWQAAAELCRQISTPHVSYRLPTEAEWKKAARGGRIQQRYSWGNAQPNASICDCDHFGDFFVRPSRSLPPNGYGLYGTCGGVWEWTSDRYDRLAYETTAPQIYDEQIQPKVLRGGSWCDCPEAVTVSFRSARGASYWRTRENGVRRDDPNAWGHYTPTIGFRLFRFEANGLAVE